MGSIRGVGLGRGRRLHTADIAESVSHICANPLISSVLQFLERFNHVDESQELICTEPVSTLDPSPSQLLCYCWLLRRLSSGPRPLHRPASPEECSTSPARPCRTLLLQ